MITLTLDTPEKLHSYLPLIAPGYIHTRRDAERLHAELQKSYPYELDEFRKYTRIYSSVTEAFYDLYPGDIDEFKAEKCEDYQITTTDFTEFYCDWLTACYSLVFLDNGDLLIITE